MTRNWKRIVLSAVLLVAGLGLMFHVVERRVQARRDNWLRQRRVRVRVRRRLPTGPSWKLTRTTRIASLLR